MPKLKWERGSVLAKTSKKKAPASFALYTVDPGGTTGSAWGVFTPQETLMATLKAHAVEAEEWTGSTLEQAFDLTHDMITKIEGWEASGIEDISILFESFQLRTQQADLSSVEVIAGTRALLHDAGIELLDTCFQSPADAKRFATSQRLKRWGLYAAGRGSDHKRDALRHLALGVNRKMSGKL